MADNIKGITIEIGGDVSPLNKALGEVNKESRSIQNELKSVERLLKLDPSNTELVAQKQKLLGEAVEKAKEKLDFLRKAQEQVEQQFKNGDMGEAEYRAFQRQVISAEQAVKSAEDAQKKYGDECEQAGKDAKEAGENSEKAGKKAKQSGDDAKGGGGGWEKFGSLAASAGKATIKGITTIATTAGTAAGAVTTAFLATAEGTRDTRTAIAKLETGFTTAGHSAKAAANTYKTLYGVLGDTDKATEASAHLALLVDDEQDLQTWTDICTGVYAQFGDSLPIEGLTEAANETAKTGALTGVLADAVNWAGVNEDEFQAKLDSCSSEQERQKLITETLNGLYSEQSDTFKDLNADVISANEAQADLTESMAKIGAIAEPIMTSLKQLAAELLSSITPFVDVLGKGLTGALNGTAGASEQLAEGIGGIFKSLLTKLAELIPQVVSILTAIIPAIINEMLASLPLLLDTLLQLLTTIVNGIAQALPSIIQTLSSVIPQLVIALSNNVPMLITAGVNLLMGLVNGLLSAIPQLLAALPQVISSILNGLLSAIPLLTEAGVGLLTALVTNLPVIITQIVTVLPQIITSIIDALLNNIPMIIQAGINLLVALIGAMPQIISTIVSAIPQIIGGLVNGFLNNIDKIILAGVQLFVSLISNLPQIIKTICSTAPQIVIGFARAIFDLIPQMANAGLNLIKGLWNGISDATSWLWGKLKGFCNGIVNKIKDFFGIHSPSRIMQDLIGVNLVKGVGVGVEVETPNLNKTLKDNLLGAVSDVSAELADFAVLDVNLLNALAVKTQGRETAPSAGNVEINFNGNYQFNDRADMDYFFNQAAVRLAGVR